MAVRGVGVVEEVDSVEAYLPRLIHGDLDPPQDLGRPHRLLEAVDTERGPPPIRVAGPEVHHHRGGEGADDTTMTTTDDVAPAVIAMIVTLDAEAAGAGRGIDEATVEGMVKTSASHYSIKNAE